MQGLQNMLHFIQKNKNGDKDQSSNLKNQTKLQVTDTFFYMKYNHSLKSSWRVSANQALDATESPISRKPLSRFRDWMYWFKYLLEPQDPIEGDGIWQKNLLFEQNPSSHCFIHWGK